MTQSRLTHARMRDISSSRRPRGGGSLPGVAVLLALGGMLGVSSVGASAAMAEESGLSRRSEQVVPGSGPAEDTEDSLRCLTLAVAHEAGNQSREGQQAVAEVVLNRLAHEAFPKTVCGVVFQGWQRGRGCQFTFVCDGALSRRLSDQTISTARSVAMGAMAPDRPQLVAGALNYHANYVNPDWAAGLARVTRIGAHIFYRPLPGGRPEGALQENDDASRAVSATRLASRWERPDHAMISRLYARYSAVGAALGDAPAPTPAALPVPQRRAEAPKVFAPWGLALR